MNWLPLFPDTTKIVDDALTIAGLSLASLADEYGTPLYIYDRATLDRSVADYRAALASTYGGAASITYAGKAYLSKALAQWTQFHNLWVDCTGEGEIAIAKAGGVPREQILSHGVNKSIADLKSALHFAGTIVVDNLDELKRIQLPITNYQSPITNLLPLASPPPRPRGGNASRSHADGPARFQVWDDARRDR